MPDQEWGSLIAAFGPVGAAAVALIMLIVKHNFFKRDAPARSDVMHKLDAMDKKMDAIDTKTDRIDRDQTDRLARIETMVKDHGRRLDRIEK